MAEGRARFDGGKDKGIRRRRGREFQRASGRAGKWAVSGTARVWHGHAVSGTACLPRLRPGLDLPAWHARHVLYHPVPARFN